MAKTIMIQGTSSDAGKSLMVAALCRVLSDKGMRVAPFKPQNMALNSAVTPCGGEVGRAQAVQALAARTALEVDFNPILLKPNSDTGAQVIVHGKALTDMEAKGYHDYKKVAMEAVLASHQRLQQGYDVIVVEGAGSPAEINLREGDIANMGFAEAVDCPVILVADIDRGGVFAQAVGTLELLSETERARTLGFIINKFRGDIGLLQSGLDWLEKRTEKTVFGVMPYLMGLDIAAEDAINTQNRKDDAVVNIAVLTLPRISNHTDFDPLRLHPAVNLVFVAPEKAIPETDLVMIPGTKNVQQDLVALRRYGWDKQLLRHLRYGGKVLGICGGYQILGQAITDPNHVESRIRQSDGLGLLPIHTELNAQKELSNVDGIMNFNEQNIPVSGYEIHAGQSELTAENVQPFVTLADGQCIGYQSLDRQVAGTYLHGLFDKDEAIQGLLAWLGHEVGSHASYQQQQEVAIDTLAKAFAESINVEEILDYCR